MSYYYTANKTVGAVSLGPELVSNPGFDSDVSGYLTAAVTFTWNAGVGEANATNNNHYLRTNVTVEAGSTYRFSWQAKRGTMSALKYSVYDWTNGADIKASTSYTVGTSVLETVSVDFTAPAGCSEAGVYPIRDSGASGTVVFDNVSVKKIL